MSRSVTLEGMSASIRWGYHLAGELGPFTVTRDADGAWSVSGTVLKSDAYRVSQCPLVFVAPHQDGSWRWPITSLQIVDGTLTASLSPPEK